MAVEAGNLGPSEKGHILNAELAGLKLVGDSVAAERFLACSPEKVLSVVHVDTTDQLDS